MPSGGSDLTIELAPEAEQSPFALMMAQLIRENLADHPIKQRDFAAMRGRVALVAEDISATLTLHFQGGQARLYAGFHGVPDLVVRGPSEALIDLSRLPNDPHLRFLPDLRSPVARSLARALYQRKLRVHGLGSHPALGLRLARVLSIYA